MSPEAAYAEGARLFNEKKSRAFPYLKYAAEQGLPKAQYALGLCYRDSLGCREDPRKTLHWYEKAAQQGHYRAQYETAEIYELGKGVPVDKKKALYWYEQAAESGTRKDWCYSVVLFACSLFYEEGRGCEVDLHKAVYWRLKHLNIMEDNLNEAVNKGREESIERGLDAVVKDMEAIHRLWTQLGEASHGELETVHNLHLMRVHVLEADINELLDKGSCRPADIPVDNLIKHLEALRQVRIQLGYIDPKEQLISKALNRLFDAIREELHEEMMLHGTSAKANELYLKASNFYKKVRQYIHDEYLPQAIRDYLSTRE